MPTYYFKLFILRPFGIANSLRDKLHQTGVSFSFQFSTIYTYMAVIISVSFYFLDD
jgi:hypothetical protein